MKFMCSMKFVIKHLKATLMRLHTVRIFKNSILFLFYLLNVHIFKNTRREFHIVPLNIYEVTRKFQKGVSERLQVL